MLPLIAWVQIGIFIILLIACTKPMGIYLGKVLNPSETTFLDPVLKPLEKFTYRLLRVDPTVEQTWVEYLFSLLVFCIGSLILTMLILWGQPYLPFNPQNLPSPSWHLNLNTAVSFMTNTNWESYAGETTLSCFSQMAGLAVQNFLSPAVGLASAAAFIRAIVRGPSPTVGNFWTDLVRICYYLLLPLCLLIAIFFISEGVPQNFSKPILAQTIEGTQQLIAQGPVASQEAIKLLGGNGGGFFTANSAHPYENPTPLCNLLQMLIILLIPAGQIYYFSHQAGHKKHGWSIYAALTTLLIAGAWICIFSELSSPTPLSQLGITGGNMEGKEQRFGVISSAFYTSVSTDSSCGAVDASLDSFTPIGSMVPLLNMMMSEVIFGGCGSGLNAILIYVIVTIFFAGLIIGRTPDYLGKKITSLDVKLTMIVLLSYGLTILGLTALSSISLWGTHSLSNTGPHGFSEILYAYTSTAANNGSAFSGLAANTLGYNLTLSLSMLVGRFGTIIPILALAGSFAGKKKIPQTPSNLLIHGPAFSIFLLGIIIIFGALTFLPALVMGPFLEHFFMIRGTFF